MRTCKQGVLAQPLNSLGACKRGVPCRYTETNLSFMTIKKVQVPFRPKDFAKFKTLVRHNRIPMSRMCSVLIEAAMELPEFQEQLEKAALKFHPKADPVKADPLHEYVPEPRTRRQPQTPKPVRGDPRWCS